MGKSSREPIIINANMVRDIMGCHIETARRRLRTIREKFGKEPRQVVTVEEFCVHTGMNVDEVREWILKY